MSWETCFAVAVPAKLVQHSGFWCYYAFAFVERTKDILVEAMMPMVREWS